jgi:hypothetical protein
MHPYMHVLGVFEVIYMHICVFSILKCRELKKNKKQKLLLELCGVYAHGKGPFDHIAVCIHTAKVPRVAHLCILGASWCACQGHCRASYRWAHGNPARTASLRRTAKIRRTAKALGARQRLAARQRKTAHGKGCHHGNETRRTAKFARHGKVLAVRIWQDARQRPVRQRTAMSLPCL